MLDSLNWCTSHTSHRSLSFILFPQMSPARPTIFHGGSTLRINLCISERIVHKDGAKCHIFVGHGSIQIYCLIMASIWMFYEKLLRNKRNSQGPPKMPCFQSWYTEYNIYAPGGVGGTYCWYLHHFNYFDSATQHNSVSWTQIMYLASFLLFMNNHNQIQNTGGKVKQENETDTRSEVTWQCTS